MRSFLRGVLILATLAMMGCNAAVTDFVRGVKPPEAGTSPTLSATGPTLLKVSPGQVNSTGTSDVAFKGTITPTNQKMSMGADMSATFTMSRAHATE